METFDRPLDFKTAFRALGALIANPDDTKQAFTIVYSLGGPSGERMFQRFKKTEVGRAVLAEKRVLLDRLKDTAALEAMPEGSLGRAYLDFLRSQSITADGLVSASEDGAVDERIGDVERQIFTDRMRDMHYLWHVVAGYRGDLIGEGAVLGLSFAQTKNPGVGLISLMGFLHSGPLPLARKTIAGGFFRGRKAAWLPAVDWEAMLPLPLEDVRQELGLGDAPSYEPIYSQDPRAVAIRERRARPVLRPARANA